METNTSEERPMAKRPEKDTALQKQCRQSKTNHERNDSRNTVKTTLLPYFLGDKSATMDEQEKLDYLAEQLMEEKELHKETKKQEEERHEKTVKAIKQGAGLGEIIALSEKVQELQIERRDKLQTLEENLRTIINKSNPYKSNKTIGSTITLRDGQVKQYNDGNKARLSHLRNTVNHPHTERQLKEVLDDEYVEDVVKSLKELKGIDLNRKTYGTHSGYYITTTVEHGEDTYTLETRKPIRPSLGGRSTVDITTKRERTIKKLIKNKQELIELYEKTIKQLERSLQTVKQVEDNISKRHSKRLTALKL